AILRADAGSSSRPPPASNSVYPFCRRAFARANWSGPSVFWPATTSPRFRGRAGAPVPGTWRRDGPRAIVR
nr:hypothetical protein [Tanacetum cinerariifolium]